MSDYNYDAKQGNLVDDPELIEYDNGGKVARFSIATSDTWQDNNGEWQERVNFFDVETMYDDQAENIAENYKKGNRVLVEGKLRQDRWEDQDGNTRSKVKIKARRVSKSGYPEGRDDAAPEEILDETEVNEVESEEEEDLFEENAEVI